MQLIRNWFSTFFEHFDATFIVNLYKAKVLESYYSQISNFEQLGDVLKIRAQLTQRLTTTEDYTYSYFYVGFWGKSFPSSVQNTAFVYRGEELERFEDFCSRLKKRFPKAEVLNYAKTIPDELKENSGQKIQVYPIKPIRDRHDATRHFEHFRSFKNDKDENAHAIERRWVERRVFTVTDAFPSISSENRVINIRSENLSPIEVACNGILEKSTKLREMIQLWLI